MADPRFFTLAGPFTLGRLAEMTGSVLSDTTAAGNIVSDVASLQDADAAKVSFLDNRKYVETFKTTKAGACFVRPDFVALAPRGTICLSSKNPYKAYALAAQAFYPAVPAQDYRASSAVIDTSAAIGKDCSIGHNVVIGRNVKIGDRCCIQAGVVICDGVQIGDDCDIGAHVYLTHCLLGSKIILHPGICVGRPGFGFALDQSGYVAVPQLGRVIIEDDVEIGANSTIDRGAGPDTVIGQGSRIDNLVQIGHNVRLGRGCVLVAQSGVSGSSQLGNYVMIGGQTGIAGHLTVGDGARVAGQSGVMRDVPPGAEVMGLPAVPMKQFMRQVATLSRIIKKKGGNEE